MVTIYCPKCSEEIVIKKEKKSLIGLDVETAKKMWVEFEKLPDSEKIKGIEEFLGIKKEFTPNMLSTSNKIEKFNKKAEDIISKESLEEKEKHNYLLESYLFTEFAKRKFNNAIITNEERKPNEKRKLKLIQSDKGSKYYQNFDQEEFKPFKSPTQIEKDIEKNVEKLVSSFAKKTLDFEPPQLLGILNDLHEIHGT
ncbi:1581_t:CDS:2 [Cetraspora pellucida]|uniref:1581_t:CDS:1 n=1 Tax=Cetraspora pellucida TaxID=1433469 RepID=A0ACA9LMZ8_9GLOM|nr:1581_t:CDS:2 [Cetraspora pellucida]